jgi:hypothetical protein
MRESNIDGWDFLQNENKFCLDAKGIGGVRLTFVLCEQSSPANGGTGNVSQLNLMN